MSASSTSLLTIIRQNKNKENNTILEIYNPEKNTVDIIPQAMLTSFENIQQIINSVKANLDHDSSSNSHYSYWQEKGWYKAIDYYVSSRENSFKEKDAESSIYFDSLNIDSGGLNNYLANSPTKQSSIPQSLIDRRTKRVFKKQPVSKKIFYEGIENTIINNGTNGIKLYFIVYNVEEINPSVYLYNFQIQQLQLVREGQYSAEMSRNIQGMNAPKTAAFSIILVADFDSLMKEMPYPRGLRDTYIEVGRLAQKIVTSYMQYGVFSLVTPALRDRDVSELLKLNEQKFSPLYSITFGYPIK